jgi:hypothetical protein
LNIYRLLNLYNCNAQPKEKKTTSFRAGDGAAKEKRTQCIPQHYTRFGVSGSGLRTDTIVAVIPIG